MTAAEGRALRRDLLRALLDERGLDAIVLRLAANFAWYTGGADRRVDRASPLGVADIVITRDAELVLTSSIEAPRMRAEQTPDLEVAEYTWYEGPEAVLGELTGCRRIGSDVELKLAAPIGDAVAALRRRLDPDAVERLRLVGRDAVEAVEQAAGSVVSGMPETDAAALLAASCRERDLWAPVLLVATDERIRAHRHPIPGPSAIERRAMLVVSAERGGLYANVTRMVHLDDPDPEIERRQAICDEILVRMREDVTTPGRTLSEAFADCARLYAEAGFPGEERRHHQGGLTGYASRELIATPRTDVRIEPGNAFAWNPSITGAKAEETFVLLDTGPEIVTPVAVRAAREL
ncbi:MAG: M24 family metallopeptidase [Gaiella sp.]